MRIYILCLSVSLLGIFFPSLGFSGEKREDNIFNAARIGKIPKERIFEMDKHVYALYYWIEQFLLKKIPADLTLIHVDLHADDLCAFVKTYAKGQKILNKLKDTPENKRKGKFEEIFEVQKVDYGIESFIIPAMHMGIINRFFWIKPNMHYFSQEGPWRKEPFFYFLLAKEQLYKADYCNQRSSCLMCDQGCGLNYFEITSLPVVTAPVLLDIDMDAFGDMGVSNFCGLSFTPEQIQVLIDKLVYILSSFTPNVYMVTLSDSIPGYATRTALHEKAFLKAKLSTSH